MEHDIRAVYNIVGDWKWQLLHGENTSKLTPVYKSQTKENLVIQSLLGLAYILNLLSFTENAIYEKSNLFRQDRHETGSDNGPIYHAVWNTPILVFANFSKCVYDMSMWKIADVQLVLVKLNVY